MEQNGPVPVSYEAKSKKHIHLGAFVFKVSDKNWMEVWIKFA